MIKHTDMYYYDLIRKNIKKFRIEKGYTQQRLSEDAGISIDFLAEIESEKRRKTFSIATLGRIAEALDIEIINFFEK